MNLQVLSSPTYVVTYSPGTNEINLSNTSESSNSYPVAVTCIMQGDQQPSITTVIYLELKKTHERIGQILAGSLNHA